MSGSSVFRPPVQLRHARLIHLLHRGDDDRPPFAFASKQAIREARALGAESATEAVVAILDGYRAGDDPALASRAACVAHELRLEGAIAALAACVEHLPSSDPMATVSAASLDLLGPLHVPQLLEAFARVTPPEVRWRLGMSLCVLRAGTPGVRAALESMLASEPGDAAVLLAHHGDRGAVPALRAALDRLAFPAPGPDEVSALQHIINVGHAVLELRGKLARPQREKLDRANVRYDELVADGTLPPEPVSC